jgi:hypothetical protein
MTNARNYRPAICWSDKGPNIQVNDIEQGYKKKQDW